MKVYSKWEQLPKGEASRNVTPGAIILEGGAFRGVYTSGVLDCLMENDINFQTTVGASAGCLNGFNYVTGSIGRAARTNLRFRHDSRWIGLKAFRQSGSFTGFHFLYNELKELEPFNESRALDPEKRFVCTATNCDTGEQEHLEGKTLEEIELNMSASSSMQLMSKMVWINGTPYLDGCCSRKIALPWVLEQGYENVIVVRTRNREFRTGERGWKVLEKPFYHKRKNLLASLAQVESDYNKMCDDMIELEKQGRIFVIAPKEPITIGSMEGDMEKLGDLYWTGYHEMEEQLDALRKYITRNEK